MAGEIWCCEAVYASSAFTSWAFDYFVRCVKHVANFKAAREPGLAAKLMIFLYFL